MHLCLSGGEGWACPNTSSLNRGRDGEHGDTTNTCWLASFGQNDLCRILCRQSFTLGSLGRRHYTCTSASVEVKVGQCPSTSTRLREGWGHCNPATTCWPVSLRQNDIRRIIVATVVHFGKPGPEPLLMHLRLSGGEGWVEPKHFEPRPKEG